MKRLKWASWIALLAFTAAAYVLFCWVAGWRQHTPNEFEWFHFPLIVFMALVDVGFVAAEPKGFFKPKPDWRDG